MRRTLLRAAKALRDEGRLPANVDNVELDRVRSASVILKEGADWISATEQARSSDAGAEVAYVVPATGVVPEPARRRW